MTMAPIATHAIGRDDLRGAGGVGREAAGIGTPRSRQKSSRFFLLSETIGWSAGSEADAIAAARRRAARRRRAVRLSPRR